ncbi:MAG: DNA-3-methyladenine glycosylase [Cyanobacteria bacterium P01_D01_bin.105]
MASETLKTPRALPSCLPADWFNRSAAEVAPDLLGRTLARRVDDEIIRSQIVETEAYEAGDPAMHAYRNKTERNAVVFGPAGIAYVYRIYRQYHCFNIVTDREQFPSTILIRAVNLQHRPSWIDPDKEKLPQIAAGPGKLCRSLKIDESLKGLPVHPKAGIWVEKGQPVPLDAITQTTRIGLSKGTDIPWRWYVTDSPAVSKKAISTNKSKN